MDFRRDRSDSRPPGIAPAKPGCFVSIGAQRRFSGVSAHIRSAVFDCVHLGFHRSDGLGFQLALVARVHGIAATAELFLLVALRLNTTV